MTLTAPEILGALERFTYLPGWRFEVVTDDELRVRIVGLVPNSWAPSDTIEIDYAAVVPPIVDSADVLYEWLIFRLEGINRHEVWEWARVNGKHVKEPHPEAAHLCPICNDPSVYADWLAARTA